MEDKQIVELYLARSETAISETEKKYGRYCHYIAYQILCSDEDAKEVVNDTYLKTWNTVPPQRPDPLKPYVGTLCRQLALDVYKGQHAQKRGGRVPLVLDELSECIPDNAGGDDIGESVALSDALNRFIWALPQKTRNIFVRLNILGVYLYSQIGGINATADLPIVLITSDLGSLVSLGVFIPLAVKNRSWYEKLLLYLLISAVSVVIAGIAHNMILTLTQGDMFTIA